MGADADQGIATAGRSFTAAAVSAQPKAEDLAPRIGAVATALDLRPRAESSSLHS